MSQTITPTPEPCLGDDVLWGAAAIAKHIKRPLRQTYYLLETRHLPADKAGATWISTKSRLHKFFNGQAPASTNT
jgi:hypothetical protein